MSYINKHLLIGERIIFRTKRHWAFLIAPSLLASLGILPILAALTAPMDGAIFFVIGILLFLPLGFAYLDFSTSEFAVTNKRVIGKVGFFNTNSLEILLTKVESINVEQDILGRLLNYGTISTGGTGASKNPFTMIANPLLVRRHVQEQVDMIT